MLKLNFDANIGSNRTIFKIDLMLLILLKEKYVNKFALEHLAL